MESGYWILGRGCRIEWFESCIHLRWTYGRVVEGMGVLAASFNYMNLPLLPWYHLQDARTPSAFGPHPVYPSLTLKESQCFSCYSIIPSA